MIGISQYTLFAAVLTSSFMIILFSIIFTNKYVMSKLSMKLIVIGFMLILIRLFIPIEVTAFTVPIRSERIIPNLIELSSHRVITLFSIDITISSLLIFIWIVVSVILLVNYFSSYLFFYKRASSTPNTDNVEIQNCLKDIMNEHNFFFPVKIIVSDIITSPAEFGFTKQTIFLPTTEYEYSDLYYILLHELTHFSNKSNWVKLIADVIRIIFWWNPVFYLLHHQIGLLIEVSIDSSITKGMNSEVKVNYMGSILNVLKLSSVNEKPMYSHLNSFLDFSENKILKKRFEIMALNEGKSGQTLYKFCFLALIVFQIISYVYIIQPAYFPIVDEFDIPQFTPENSYIIKDGDTLYLYYKDVLFIQLENIGNFNNIPIFIKGGGSENAK